MPDGKPQTINASDIDLDYGTIIRMKQNNETKVLQFLDTSDDLNFNFYFKGNTINSQVFNPSQY